MMKIFQHASTICPIADEAATEEDAKACYSTHYDFECCFINPNIQKHYENFRIKRVTSSTIFLWICFATCYIANSALGLYVLYSDYESDFYLVKCLLIGRVFLSFLILLCCYLIVRGEPKDNCDVNLFHRYVSLITNLTNFIIVGFALVNGIMLIWRSSLKSCSDYNDNYTYSFDCNDSFNEGGMPRTPLLWLLLTNLALINTLQCHRYWATQILNVVTIICCSVSTILAPLPLKSVFPFLFVFASVIICREQERSMHTMFRSLLSLESNNRRQMLEMKHFIGNVAHDLKTPLHGLLMSIDSMIDDTQTILPQSEWKTDFTKTLEVCKTDCSFMTMAINRTLDFTKSTSNIVLQPHRETTSAQECLQWAVKCIRTTQQRIPIIVQAFPPDICDNLVTDKHWLMENILCYLSNAVKYSSGGSVTIRVCLRDDFDNEINSATLATCTNPQLRVIVEDEGIGISDENKAKLFKPFQQTMRLAGGTGLGLYSLSKRMEALGGKYGVTDREDKHAGSQFWFSIPYTPDLDSAIRKVSSSGNTPLVSVRKRRDKINDCIETIDVEQNTQNLPSALIVEDSAVISKATTRMLTRAGYFVECAENGVVGLEKMKARQYDIVVMDLQMPIMDGLEATRRLRIFEGEMSDVESPRPRQFIVGVSANGTDDVRREALGSGMDVFCSKPFSFDDFLKLDRNIKI